METFFFLSFIDKTIILLVLITTLVAVIYATRKKSSDVRLEALAGRSLGPWVLALSAGATANSGFVLTGAVGLGYAYGLMWCLLPLGWLIGDLIFWSFFAKKINVISHNKNIVTLPEFLAAHTNNGSSRVIRTLSAIILVVLMTAYISSQWLSAGKIGGYVFGTDILTTAVIFGFCVAVYTAFSGFRGAVYTDFIQAIFMLILAVTMLALSGTLFFEESIATSADLPDEFLSLTGTLSWWQVLLFLIGFTLASIGFNLGQPQMVTRWMAAKSESDIKKAQWLYIGFIQLTWMTYTFLGAVIRLVIEDIEDAEQGLFIFVNQFAFPGLIGLLIAGTMATIASTAASALAVCGEMIRNDIVQNQTSQRKSFVLVIVFISFLWLLVSDMNVFELSIMAVSLIGASLAAPMIYCLLFRPFGSLSCQIAIISGLFCGILWKYLGFSNIVNEALLSITVGFMLLLALNRKHS